jgi:hypothetical protein
MSNTPIYETDNISIGQCILYIGSVGETPTTDVGVIDDTQLNVETEFIEVEKKDSSRLHQKYPISNKVTVSGIIKECNYETLAKIVSSSSGTTNSFLFGGVNSNTKYSILLEHQIPEEDLFEIKIWKVIGSGSLSVDFNDIHSFQLQFESIKSIIDWEGNSLVGLGSLFRIERSSITGDIYIITNDGSYVTTNSGNYVIK